MKLAILGDTHWSARNDSIHFYDYFNKFYQEVFFPYLKEHKISTVIQTGDLFDRRKYINFSILRKAKKDFFDWFADNKVNFHAYLGNHDVYYNNTIDVNSPTLLLAGNPAVFIITEPCTKTFDGVALDFIPWICQGNEQQVLEFIKASKSQICFGHFELSGFEMDRGNFCHEGMDKSVLAKYEMVFSGHFHHRSTDGHILYVGAPYEMTYADVNDMKGFHIFDTETRLIEFVENPFKMFHKIKYDDENEFTFEYMKSLDLSQYSGAYIKLIVVNKANPYLFETFVEALYKVNPIDITIIEDRELDLGDGEEEILQTEDTPEIIKKHIEGLDLNVDKEILYRKIHEIYTEAVNLEKI